MEGFWSKLLIGHSSYYPIKFCINKNIYQCFIVPKLSIGFKIWLDALGQQHTCDYKSFVQIIKFMGFSAMKKGAFFEFLTFRLKALAALL